MMRTTWLSLALVLLASQLGFAQDEIAIAREALKVLVISRETTFDTEPLNEFGFPDYRAITNAEQSKGVAPEENFWAAAVPFLPGAELTPEYIAKLTKVSGFEEAGNSSKRFVPLRSKWDEQAVRQIAATMDNPWVASDYPEIDQWLNRNKAALDGIAAAAKRPKAFFPMIPMAEQRVTGGSDASKPIAPKDERRCLCAARLPHVTASLELTRCYFARANRSFGAGKIEQAWEDIVTLLQISKHLASKGCGTIEHLASHRIKNESKKFLVQCLSRADWSGDEVRSRWECLASLLKPADALDSIDTMDRRCTLDILLWMHAGRVAVDFVENPEGDSIKTFEAAIWQGAMNIGDINERLRFANQSYDRLLEARAASIGNRMRAALRAHSSPATTNDRDPVHLAISYLLTGPKSLDREIDRQVIQRTGSAHSIDLPCGRVMVNQVLLHAAFSVEYARRLGGEAPGNGIELRALCQSLLPLPEEAGTDLVTAGSLNIANTEQGLKIYSVGLDRKDSKGELDDIAVVLPKKCK